VDGSGEKKLTDIAKKDSLGSVQMQWSPNGKWISYKADDGLWLISRDGSIKKKILSAEELYIYTWSPDSLKIAYMARKEFAPVAIAILNLETGKASELFSYTPFVTLTLLWSPDGRYLLYTDRGRGSFSIFDLTTHQVVTEISSAFNSCYIDHKGISWSPNSRWFFNIPSQNGRFATKQICVAGLDGSHRQVDINGTATSYPIWDKTGNFIYFAASNTNFSITPIPDYDLRLMRYDVRTQKLERLLSLGKEPKIWTVSISPNGRILEMDTTTSENQQSYIFLDLESLATTRYEVSETPGRYMIFNGITYWSPDSQYIIFLSQSNSCFYKFDVQIGKVTIISGKHSIDYWAVSLVATTP
jgi:Tol biopolymer transport system component